MANHSHREIWRDLLFLVVAVAAGFAAAIWLARLLF